MVTVRPKYVFLNDQHYGERFTLYRDLKVIYKWKYSMPVDMRIEVTWIPDFNPKERNITSGLEMKVNTESRMGLPGTQEFIARKKFISTVQLKNTTANYKCPIFISVEIMNWRKLNLVKTLKKSRDERMLYAALYPKKYKKIQNQFN